MSVKGTAAKGPNCTGQVFWVCTGIMLMGLTGCAVQQFIPAGPLPYKQLSSGYFQINLQQSSALDVIRSMQSQQGKLGPKHVETEVFSQSDTTSALSGQSKDSDKRWFTLCAFDQYDMTVRRKYFFYMDESAMLTPTGPKRCLIPARGTLVFDGALVISDVLERAHASDVERNIAVLRYVREKLQQDSGTFDGTDASSGNDIVAVSGMLMNQVLGSGLFELDKSPSLAAHMTGSGLDFDHITLDRGRIRLKIQGEVALMRIELGLPT